ncbi:hypothetical protein [Streptomyces sp. YIM 98790]|uniref:hypothetical protein n=1 Tax=Streptomyces sp. YIM 98790 TaxID=2689077 RepID=UPI00140A7ED7|nr:hypothetical protein [Streptomyces sp. YIM 98790]
MPRRRAPRLAITALALAAPFSLTSCDAISTALDCANTAVTIANTVGELQQAAESASWNPVEARESLDSIDRNLDELRDQTGNADLVKAVEELQAAVDNVRQSADTGAPPDLTPVVNASEEVTSVCSPG